MTWPIPPPRPFNGVRTRAGSCWRRRDLSVAAESARFGRDRGRWASARLAFPLSCGGASPHRHADPSSPGIRSARARAYEIGLVNPCLCLRRRVPAGQRCLAPPARRENAPARRSMAANRTVLLGFHTGWTTRFAAADEIWAAGLPHQRGPRKARPPSGTTPPVFDRPADARRPWCAHRRPGGRDGLAATKSSARLPRHNDSLTPPRAGTIADQVSTWPLRRGDLLSIRDP